MLLVLRFVYVRSDEKYNLNALRFIKCTSIRFGVSSESSLRPGRNEAPKSEDSRRPGHFRRGRKSFFSKMKYARI